MEQQDARDSTVAGLDFRTRLTATAIAKEWIFALASTTLELMKPPYDYNSKAQEYESVVFKKLMNAEKRGIRARQEPQMNPGRLTQPQIPIRFGSTYGFFAQALHKIISRQFGRQTIKKSVKEPSRHKMENKPSSSVATNRNKTR